ncbi:MAG: electron transport complex subunit RsxA [Bacteroidales bacterium]|nr:electron transport complex subunit RsxA [Bacteroidales bacterium]NLK80898.1 electron transport complex subunit RsxA [Bacteroidales bacterium]
MDYVLIIISAVLVNNIVLAQFLGICPFLGVSNKVSTALGMSGAVLFVIVLSTIVTYLLNQYVLLAYDLAYLRTISFIFVIAALVQMVEIILKKISPALYEALGVFLPLITTNCAVLGLALLAVGMENASLLKAVLFSASNALGFGLAITLFAGIREQIHFTDIPQGMQGAPISLITAGLLSMAFMGFAGLV